MKMLLIILCVLLGGCSTMQTHIVKVPIPLPCKGPVEKPIPYLPIYSLKPTSTPSEVMHAYEASIYLLLGR